MKIKILLFISIFGIILGLLYSSLPAHHPNRNKQACESVGGIWSMNQKCLLSYKKSGERCTDGAQCISGICSPHNLSEEQKAILKNKPLKNITGKCSNNNEPFGCVPEVILGTVSKESSCLIK